ncbi:MAG TPA: hypothetical protein VEH04_14460 [Verrucomicrobiae bacterium]|nr:hypothetical protein [Verrucomicrobiae bacterium]
MNTDRQPLVTVEDVTRQVNMTGLIGRQVNWNNVPVQTVLSEQYLIVGAESGKGVVVRLKETIPGIQAGQRVNIAGMIAQLGEDLAQWELDPDKKQRIRDHTIFVNAFQSSPQ